ncbi:hypothetical protein CYMTET_15260 [Cymbomonas tetramitiformis]|uniref:Pyrroline-5-carboxylate reductase catalytic N-terminal domain-containing protein n=1 Tax=Cymbomonas tetramitiformis TaxID=36881 RepID=A0AAE0GEQ5_9CHLO|nr:hypothetical protein CYMTET_48869 [Cymbomonas tetramitiformis]KAK3276688.1 hypothetical protein CYMTET_15260 [Cymbomonas tetramitiformis]
MATLPPEPVGFIGCGRMGLAIAGVLSKAGIPVFLGSRDGGGKARECAKQLAGPTPRGGSYAEVAGACTVLYICLANPGRSDPVCEFLDNHRAALMGKGKILIDPSNPWGYAHWPPPSPHKSALTYHAEYLGDPTAEWATAYKSIMWTSVANYKLQPTEICGTSRARAVLSELIRAHGFEPVDCGDLHDAPVVEINGPLRKKHPRITEYDRTGK